MHDNATRTMFSKNIYKIFERENLCIHSKYTNSYLNLENSVPFQPNIPSTPSQAISKQETNE